MCVCMFKRFAMSTLLESTWSFKESKTSTEESPDHYFCIFLLGDSPGAIFLVSHDVTKVENLQIS